jgi:low temperature requirement protein LtrA
MPEAGRPRFSPTLREGERVTPLELFFDLVFVLALTQCTALMSHHPSWTGLVQGLLVLSMLWWSWTAYAWLTSVLDPEEGAVRLLMFAVMAALLIVSLCVPEAFGELALVFALAYGAVRIGHIGLFMLASPDDDALRHSVLGLAVSTTIAVSLLTVASFFDGVTQGAIWVLALALDMGGPFLVGTEGWKLVPGHFAERHGLVVIIALGESVVAIGVGAAGALDLGIGTAAVLGVALTAAMWWAYFDVVATVAERKLREATGPARAAIARDSYSYLHLPMVAGIVLFAFAMKATLADVGGELDTIPAFGLCWGPALYLLAYVATRVRISRTPGRGRLVAAIACAALWPVATVVPALVALTLVTIVWLGLHAYEIIWWREARAQTRALRAPAS